MRNISELKDMREAEMLAILELAEEHDDIVFLDADLSDCSGSACLKKQFPKRFYNCGIAEANMMAVAGGLSSMGFKPFIHSFGCFATRRAFDQIFISLGYTHQVAHIIGTDPGITAQSNGGTHMPFEDIALMRQVPNSVIINPSDGMSCYKLTKQLYENDVLSYTRIRRKGITHRYDDKTEIKLGKGIVLEEGKDVGIIACGEVMVDLASEAVKELQKEGIKPTLVDLHTIRPLDTDLIDKLAKECGRILVCENGRYCGGLGEEISYYLSKTNPVKMDYINVGDRFGEVGDLEYLKNSFGFTKENVKKTVYRLLF